MFCWFGLLNKSESLPPSLPFLPLSWLQFFVQWHLRTWCSHNRLPLLPEAATRAILKLRSKSLSVSTDFHNEMQLTGLQAQQYPLADPKDPFTSLTTFSLIINTEKSMDVFESAVSISTVVPSYRVTWLHGPAHRSLCGLAKFLTMSVWLTNIHWTHKEQTYTKHIKCNNQFAL